MTDANGHAPAELEPAEPASATRSELEALLAGHYEPTRFEFAPGRFLEIRPLRVKNSDRLYAGGMDREDMQRFLLARCIYVNGNPLGYELADELPFVLAGQLVPLVMRANGMAQPDPTEAVAAGEGDDDPKA